MPIFISYSQKDKKFVDNLAENLVLARHNVWMDRWELAVGDSLTEKIQGALTSADAILVVLSNNSVESNWCKRELNAALIRELEEISTLVLPCIIDDCEIPLFLRDKLYADFRNNPDQAFSYLNQSLSKISNPFQNRSEEPEFYTDWGVDWKLVDDGTMQIRWVFVEHGNDLPFVVLSELNVFCNDLASLALLEAQQNGTHGEFLRNILQLMVDKFDDDEPLQGRIEDQHQKSIIWSINGSEGQSFTNVFNYRRMGEDTGMDTLVHLDGKIKIALSQMTDVLFEPEK